MCKRNICYIKFKITCGVRSQGTRWCWREGWENIDWESQMGWTMCFLIWWWSHRSHSLCGHSSSHTGVNCSFLYMEVVTGNQFAMIRKSFFKVSLFDFTQLYELIKQKWSVQSDVISMKNHLWIYLLSAYYTWCWKPHPCPLED